MGETTSRYFRDKLAMRMAASEKGIRCPAFVSIFHRDDIQRFMEKIPAPWMLKPRSQAGAAGIKKIHSAQQLWEQLDQLGDQQSHFLLEQFIPGDIFHVDAITTEGQVVFEEVSRYGKPPLDIIQGGGIFMTSLQNRHSPDAVELKQLSRKVIAVLGFKRGVTHTEFIKSREDGQFYFLETAARVGGAYIADVIEHATGINLWTEWAKIEIAGGKMPYTVPEHRENYGGIVLCLARQEWPDLSAYNDPEIVYRVHKQNHAGLIVASPDADRIQSLMNEYSQRFVSDFLAIAPQYEKLER
jgi:biotin carboxylase